MTDTYDTRFGNLVRGTYAGIEASRAGLVDWLRSDASLGPGERGLLRSHDWLDHDRPVDGEGREVLAAHIEQWEPPARAAHRPPGTGAKIGARMAAARDYLDSVTDAPHGAGKRVRHGVAAEHGVTEQSLRAWVAEYNRLVAAINERGLDGAAVMHRFAQDNRPA